MNLEDHLQLNKSARGLSFRANTVHCKAFDIDSVPPEPGDPVPAARGQLVLQCKPLITQRDAPPMAFDVGWYLKRTDGTRYNNASDGLFKVEISMITLFGGTQDAWSMIADARQGRVLRAAHGLTLNLLRFSNPEPPSDPEVVALTAWANPVVGLAESYATYTGTSFLALGDTMDGDLSIPIHARAVQVHTVTPISSTSEIRQRNNRNLDLAVRTGREIRGLDWWPLAGDVDHLNIMNMGPATSYRACFLLGV